MKKKIYISGPISGYEYDERKSTFKLAKEMLEGQGYEVFNPLENGCPPDATTHQHMRADLKMLVQCEEIFLLDKWNHSAGCFVEFIVAVAIGCKVTFSQLATVVPVAMKKPEEGLMQVLQTIFR